MNPEMKQKHNTMNRVFTAFAATAVMTAAFSCSDRSGEWDACGQIDATKVTVSAESGGKITALDIKEGDRVSAGQIIGAVDSVQIFLQKEELQSRKEGAATRMVDADLQLLSQENRLENMEKDLARFRSLLSRDAGTQKQVDDAESEIKVLRSQIAAQRKSYEDGNKGIRSEMLTYDIQIAELEDKLEKCRITVPMDGVVLTKYAEAGETATVGQPLFEMADMDNVFVRAYFSADQLTGIKTGDKVKVVPDTWSSPSREYDGTVTWISDEAEFTPKNIQTKNERADLVYAVKVSVKNDGFLRLGMYAYVKVR